MANAPIQHSLIDDLKKITLPWAQFFSTLAGSNNFQSLGTFTASNSSALTVTGITGHSSYLLLINSMLPQNAGGADIYMQASTDNGASFVSGNNYEWGQLSWGNGSSFSPTGVSDGGGGDTQIKMALAVSGDVGFFAQLWTGPLNKNKKAFQWAGTKTDTSFNTKKADGYGSYYGSSSTMNALQFTCSTGNISGSVTCIGLF